MRNYLPNSDFPIIFPQNGSPSQNFTFPGPTGAGQISLFSSLRGRQPNCLALRPRQISSMDKNFATEKLCKSHCLRHIEKFYIEVMLLVGTWILLHILDFETERQQNQQRKHKLSNESNMKYDGLFCMAIMEQSETTTCGVEICTILAVYYTVTAL